MGYARAIKVSALRQVLPPSNKSILSVSKEMGIADQTIRNWINECKSGNLVLEDIESSPRNITAKEKYQILLEASSISEENLGSFLRERGIHSEHLTLWDQELREMVTKKEDKKDKEIKALKKQLKDLEKELNRKEKALAEAAALLILKKKLDVLTGDDKED
jgi:transposase-like protein